MSGLALKTTVLTLHTTIKLRLMLLMKGCAGEYHHIQVAVAAMISST